MSFDHRPKRMLGRWAIAALAGAALVAPAAADASGDSVWAECATTGTVSTNHSQKDFTDALTNAPADAAEYTDCEALIRAAQNKAASGGGKSGSSGAGALPGVGGGGTGGGTGSAAVDPGSLQKALSAGGVNPAAPPGAAPAAPAPVVVDGKKVDLSDDRVPSIANALSLPLPLAASAVVVMLSAAMPIARYLVARFGGPPTGTSPST